jgi:hypothetical protein
MISKLSLIKPSLHFLYVASHCLAFLTLLESVLKLGRTPRDKVSHIFALEVLDVSMIILFILNLAHLLCILIRSVMPCSCFTTSSCLLLHHHPQITILIVDLNTILGFFNWLNLSPLGWAILCKMSHIMAPIAHEVRNLFFLHFLVLALALAF